MNRFQLLLSDSTCAGTPRAPVAVTVQVEPEAEQDWEAVMAAAGDVEQRQGHDMHLTLISVSGLVSNISIRTFHYEPNGKRVPGTLWERSPSRPIASQSLTETCRTDTECEPSCLELNVPGCDVASTGTLWALCNGCCRSAGWWRRARPFRFGLPKATGPLGRCGCGQGVPLVHLSAQPKPFRSMSRSFVSSF